MDVVEIKNDVVKWVYEAGAHIRKALKSELIVHKKTSETDLVTNTDREVEQFFVKKIQERFPNHTILGEEGFGNYKKQNGDYVWLIDPIDGTLNFIHQQENFAISVALYQGEEGLLGILYDVMKDELFVAVKGHGVERNGQPFNRQYETTATLKNSLVGLNARWFMPNRRIDHEALRTLIGKCRSTRSYGSAVVEFLHVVKGGLDAYIAPRLCPWDFAASKIVLEELHYKVVNTCNESFTVYEPTGIVAGNPNVVKELFQLRIVEGKK